MNTMRPRNLTTWIFYVKYNQPMTEAQIERKICDHAKLRGCIAYKFTSPGRAGVPDRVVLLPDASVIFIEVKTPTGIVSALQKNEHRLIQACGHTVYVVDSVAEGKRIIDEHI